MKLEHIKLDIADHVATVALNRPPVNAFNRALRQDVTRAFDTLHDRDDVRAIDQGQGFRRLRRRAVSQQGRLKRATLARTAATARLTLFEPRLRNNSGSNTRSKLLKQRHRTFGHCLVDRGGHIGQPALGHRGPIDKRPDRGTFSRLMVIQGVIDAFGVETPMKQLIEGDILAGVLRAELRRVGNAADKVECVAAHDLIGDQGIEQHRQMFAA
jgi:hypothetical protein